MTGSRRDSRSPRALRSRFASTARLFGYVVVTVFALGLFEGIGQADMLDSFGAGAAPMAAAGTGVATRDDFSATFYNPAMLAMSRAVHVGGGYQLVVPSLSFDHDLPLCTDDPDSCGGQHPAGYRAQRDVASGAEQGFTLGFSVPFDLSALALGDASIGVLLYFPTGQLVSAGSQSLERPQFLLYQSNQNHFGFNFSFGLRPFSWLALGAGARILTDIHGTQTLDLDVVNNNFSRQDTRVAVHPKTALIAGLVLRPTTAWTLAASYHGDLFLGYYLPSLITVNEIADFNMGYALESAYSPKRFTLALAWEAPTGLELTAELGYALWSQMPIPSPPTNIDVEGPLVAGMGYEEAVDIDSYDAWPKDSIRDQWRLALGAEVPLLPWLSLVTGYSWRQAVIDGERGQVNYVDNDRHQLAYGLRATLRTGLAEELLLGLNLAGTTNFLPSRSVKNSLEGGGGDYSHGGWIQSFALSVDIRYDAPKDTEEDTP